MALPHDTRQALVPVVVRRAEPRDMPGLARLAGRDCKRVPAGPLLLAESEGEIVAALPLAGGEAVADPFRPTAALVSLLELRAAQLRRAQCGGGRSRLPARAWIARAVRRPATG